MGCNIVVIVRNLQRITLRIVLMYAGIAIQLHMIQKIAQTGVSTARHSHTTLKAVQKHVYVLMTKKKTKKKTIQKKKKTIKIQIHGYQKMIQSQRT